DVHLGQHAGVGDVLLERTLVYRVGVSVVRIDLAGGNRRKQRLVEQLHAEVAPHLQLARNLVRLLGLDELGDGLGHHEDLAYGLAAARIRRLHQDLGHDGEQALREEALGLFPFFDRQRIDDAIDGLDGARGVQRSENEVAGLRRRHRHRDGFGVAQLAYEDDVRILTHGGAYALRKSWNMRAELPLDHLAVLAAVNELDRILETDDVELTGLVQVIDHRRQRGGLAGARRAGDQDHSLVIVAELRDDGGQAHLLQRGDLRGNGTEGSADSCVLAEDVDAETAAVRRYVGEVEVLSLAEMLSLGAAHDLRDVAFELRRAQIAEFDRQEIALHAQHRWHADGKM